jgi:DNA modification methylase
MMHKEVIGLATLYLGDCRDVLRTLGTGGIAAVITDPPYGINTKSDGAGKLNPWADLCNAAFWYADWLAACQRLVFPKGCVWTFLNWRSLPTFQKASCDIRWPIESLLVWDKEWIGPGGQKGLRPSYELAALFAGDDFAIDDRGIPDIRRAKWSSQKPHGHPAEKPEDLMSWLVLISTERAGKVLDPFMGSGTTGAAAVKAGREFVGVEMDPEWFSVACRRIEEAQRQGDMFRDAPQ